MQLAETLFSMLSIKTQQYRADHKSAELQLSFLILGRQEFIVCLVLTDPQTKLSKEASFRLSYFFFFFEIYFYGQTVTTALDLCKNK